VAQVKGDGSGDFLFMQLGILEPGQPTTYYPNRAEGIALDFTGWREVGFSLALFGVPSGRDLEEDMARIDFIQYMVNRRGDHPETEIWLKDLRVIRATEEEQAMIAERRAMLRFDLTGPPPRDGGNLLPNPDFERDFLEPGQPDLWRANGRGDRFALDEEVARNGRRSLRISFEDDIQTANLSLARSFGAGHWVFEAWYRTEGVPRAPRHATSVRLRVVDAGGVQVHTMSLFGEETGGEWRRILHRFESHEAAHRLDVILNHFGGEGTVWWDHLSLRFDSETAAAVEAGKRTDAEQAELAAAALAPLAERVEALPETTPEERLKKAALQWAVEDARTAIGAELGSEARTLMADIAAMLGQPLGRRQTPPGDLLAPIESFATNPYVAGLVREAETLARNNRTFQKGREGYHQFKVGWELSGVSDRALNAVWALGQPNSPLADDPRLLVFVLRHLQALFQSHVGGDLNPYRALSQGYHDDNINRFAYRPGFEAYLILQAVFPDLIPPSKKAAWDRSVREVLDFQLATYGDAKPRLEDIRYPNMDVMYMLMMALGARLLDDEPLMREGRRFLEGMEACLFPDGAFTYHGQQNEVFGYHQINIGVIARYWQITGDDLAREIVLRSRPYYPLVVEPAGITECYTDCFWKHNWPRIAPAPAPEIVAGLAGCPYNKRVANQALAYAPNPKGQYAMYAATFYRDFPDQPLPDGYIVHDRNTQGPRGRFGRFSFAATGRSAGPGQQGRDTFAGCMVADEPGAANPLNAALKVATNQYRIALGGQRWRNCRYLSEDERNADTIGPDFAGFSTRYRIQNVAWGGRSTLTDWAGNQQWLMTPQRLVGLLEIETLEDQQAFSIHGRVRLGAGRGRNLEQKEIERKDDSFFKYGLLLCRLHEHNYADVVTEKSETFYIETPEDFASREIVLRDAASVFSSSEERRTYPKGTRQFFVVEVFPGWSEPARSATRIATPEGLRGVELDADGRHLLLLHNPTDGELAYRAPRAWATGRVDLHRSDGAEPQILTLDGQIDVVLSPHQHAVFSRHADPARFPARFEPFALPFRDIPE